MAIIILDSHPSEDGRIMRHVRYLVDQGFEVYRLNYNYRDMATTYGEFSHFGEKGFKIDISHSRNGVTLIRRILNDLVGRGASECLEILKQLGLDPTLSSIIHVHDPGLLPLARSLMRRYLPDSRLIYDRHELYDRMIAGSRLPTYSICEWVMKGSISAVVMVSENHALQTKELFPGVPIITVPNYPLSEFYDKELITDKMQTFGESSMINAVYIGSLGALDRDASLLIKIAEATLRSHDNIRYLVGGTNVSHELNMMFKSLSEENPGRFQFLGHVSRKEAIELTQAAHIGFHLIRPDTNYWVSSSPNKVFEYLMCGTVPIIRADVDHAKELRKCSLLFERYDDDETIMMAVQKLLDNPDEISDLMRRARRLSANYSWESVADRYVRIYDLLSCPETDPGISGK